MISMRIALEAANQPEVLALIEQLDAYQKPLYPAESHHGIDIPALSEPNVIFAVARDEQGQAIGCGAIVLETDYGELKRMFTLPNHRGKGIARSLLLLLESEAQARGCQQFMLETGYLQAEAIALYERFGYSRRGPFGSYNEDPNSVFMHKKSFGTLGGSSAQARVEA
jgi:putative acetyltransferase